MYQYITRKEAIKLGLKTYIGKACPMHKHQYDFCERSVDKSDCLIAHRIRSIKWNKDNKERHNTINRRSKKGYPERRCIEAAKRRALKLNSWNEIGDKEKNDIKEMYETCKRLTEITGIVFHVDHIVPLSKGGKHRFENLQILTAYQNLKKHNRLNYVF